MFKVTITFDVDERIYMDADDVNDGSLNGLIVGMLKNEAEYPWDSDEEPKCKITIEKSL